MYAEFDAFLRADGNRRNPGTTADLIAAILFAGLRDGQFIPDGDWYLRKLCSMTKPASETWSVRVTKDTLVFSAAHFITFNRNVCERIHGHNWRVEAEIEGRLDENHYVFDFIALRDGLQTLVQELDHRVLLPDRHPMIQVEVVR